MFVERYERIERDILAGRFSGRRRRVFWGIAWREGSFFFPMGEIFWEEELLFGFS